MVVAESAMSFLGLGVQPPTPTLGGIISDGRAYVSTAWWVTTCPGVVLMGFVLGIGFVGDWLRSASIPGCGSDGATRPGFPSSIEKGADVHSELGIECHTFTIIGHCARTGVTGIALASSPLAVAARCVFIRANAGAGVDTGARASRSRAAGGAPPRDGLRHRRRCSRSCAAPTPASSTARSASWTATGIPACSPGAKNLDWKGHIAQKHFVAMGNHLTSERVVKDMAEAFQASADEVLEERLMRALEAGKAAGGEKGGQLSSGLTAYGRDNLRADGAAGGHVRPADRTG